MVLCNTQDTRRLPYYIVFDLLAPARKSVIITIGCSLIFAVMGSVIINTVWSLIVNMVGFVIVKRIFKTGTICQTRTLDHMTYHMALSCKTENRD
jgi:hypothetical protein